jgi:hypothetical protein
VATKTPKQAATFEVLFWIVVIVGIPMVIAAEWYRGVVALQEPPFRPELAGPTDGLRTLIWTTDAGVASSSPIRLWVLFDNQTKKSVKDLHFLNFETPGFDKAGSCWSGENPICSPGGKTPLLRQTGLNEGDTAVVYGTLRPKHWYGRHGAGGTLVWSSNGRYFRRAVILPGVEVHSEVLDLISGMGKAIEICALPFMLAFLGWKLKQREEQAKEERDQQVRLQEIWSRQLPKVIEEIKKYHLPVYIAISNLCERSKDLHAQSSDEEIQHGLFRLQRLLRRMDHLSEEIGGFSFKNKEGEELAATCWALFEEANRKQFKAAEEDGARVADAIQPQISLAQFKDLINGSPETGFSDSQRRRLAESLTTLTGCLREWIADGHFQKDLAPLEVLHLILSFEMDRPLELWYGYLPAFPAEAFKKAAEGLQGDKNTNLVKRLLAYSDTCTKDAKASRERWEKSHNSTEQEG